MLRALVAALLLVNLVFYTWTHGWLDGLVGTRSIGDREPERLSRQVRPEIVRIVPAASAGAASGPATGASAGGPATPASSAASASAVVADAAPPVALVCLEAGPFNDAAANAAQAAARGALPGADLTLVKTTTRTTWMVYMGRYADQEALKKKEDELRRRRLSYEEVRGSPSLTPGLSLGRFDDRNDAAKALEQFAQQGIRTARIIEYLPSAAVQMLRIEKADAPLVSQAMGLKLAPLGKGFAPCAKPS